MEEESCVLLHPRHSTRHSTNDYHLVMSKESHMISRHQASQSLWPGSTRQRVPGDYRRRHAVLWQYERHPSMNGIRVRCKRNTGRAGIPNTIVVFPELHETKTVDIPKWKKVICIPKRDPISCRPGRSE